MVTVTDANGCEDRDSTVIEVLTIDITQNDTTICEGASIVLQSNSGTDSTVIDQFTIYSASYFSRTTPVFESNKTYVIEVSGRYGIADGWSHADAAFDYAWDTITNTKVFCNGNQHAVEHIRWKFDGLSNFKRPDNNVSNNFNNAFCSGIDKTYFWTIQGDNATHEFEFSDTPYSDNTGSLNFKIHELTQNGLTYNWSPGGETISTITAQPATTTTYTVDVTSGTTTCQDSVIISVNPIDDVTIDSTVCDSVLWAGDWLTTSGTYYDTLQNMAGCDSIVTLSLTTYYATSSDTQLLYVVAYYGMD